MVGGAGQSRTAKQKGARSPRWALFGTLALDDELGPYLKRLRTLQTPRFGLFLHRIYRGDPDLDLHDHPYDFISIPLWGGYVEEVMVGGERVRRRVRWLNVKRAEDLHRVASVDRSPTVTLVLVGRRRRAWGFQTPRGWIDADDYTGAGSGVSA